jgi:hypothetical protein
MPTLKVWDSGQSAWIEVGGTPIVQQTTAPVTPVAGDLWIDTDEVYSVGSSSMLIAEQTVSGSAATSIIFSELDGLTHGGYIIEAHALLSNSTELDVSFPSQGTVVARRVTSQGSSAGGDAGSGAASPTLTVNFSGGTVWVYGFMTILPTATNTYTVGQYFQSGATTYGMWEQCVIPLSVNITSMTITSTTASGIGVGSTFRVYRRK